MKTLEETKKGLECCQHDQYSGLCQCDKGCPYRLADKCDHLRRDALFHIQQLESAQPKWISVEERLPEPNVAVLTLGRRGGIAVGYITRHSCHADGHIYFYHRYGDSYPTHWMPLPEAPKEDT